MLAIAADKIKALNSALAKPFLLTAEKIRPQAKLFSQSLGQSVDKETTETTNAGRFSAQFSNSRRDIVRAQRLRYRVFSEEYGAEINSPFGLDRDHFDKHCLHLIVRDNQTGEMVGYTRVLPHERVVRSGGYYSAGEFDLTMLDQLDGRIAEIGRTCIHPDYRNGAVIAVLWSRLAQYMIEADVRYLIGCASVALSEGYDVAAIVQRIRDKHLSESHQRVMPRQPLHSLQRGINAPTSVRMPPLLKAYLRMGAQVCGEPCWDPEFNCLDFFILLSLDRLPQRYVQHFLQPLAV